MGVFGKSLRLFIQTMRRCWGWIVGLLLVLLAPSLKLLWWMFVLIFGETFARPVRAALLKHEAGLVQILIVLLEHPLLVLNVVTAVTVLICAAISIRHLMRFPEFVLGTVTKSEPPKPPLPRPFFYLGLCWDVLPHFFQSGAIPDRTLTDVMLDHYIDGPFCVECARLLRRRKPNASDQMLISGLGLFIEESCGKCKAKTPKTVLHRPFREIQADVYEEARRLVRLNQPFPAGDCRKLGNRPNSM